jgi:class 3 adenylate cyclase/tetratricopeptide (TPR) repeat protein
VITCATCGAENRGGARFCDSCGTALEAEPAREQRKTVTVLFCDVTGSTARAERLDPEATRAVMAEYFETARTAIERHGGTVEKFIGDAVMAVFGVPQVHEDDALRAVRAAIELRDGVGIDVRIGVNTGPVVTGTGDTLVTGDAVNVAARLEQAAAPGEALIGGDTYGLVRDAVDAELLPPLEAKGKSSPLTAYRLRAVTGEQAHARRFDAPLVGRTRESKVLADAWERVCSENSCALFTVLGAAGVGKSRLAREFVDRVDATVVRGRCLSYGEGITYWPVVELVKQLLDERGVPASPGIAALLGQGQASTDEIAYDVRKLLEAAATARPLVVLLDDVHWGEPAFLDLVEHVADWSRDAPILLLCLARPELLDRRPGWSGGKLNATTVLLEPLRPDEAHDLVVGLLGGVELEPGLRERILAAADGNPLFVEEILAMVRDQGVSDVRVPPTIQALLAARIDQLPQSERGALERGAVEGHVFHRGTVEALAPEDSGVATHLMGLVRKELVRPSPAVLPGDDAFRFRHLLIRDAAYEALPKATRADLHERFADWIGERGADLVELEEILGYHLEQAAQYRTELGRPDDALAARASAHLATAGTRALDRTDLHAAANLLERATELLAPDDPARVRLLPALVESIYGTGDLDRCAELLAQAVEQGQAIGDRATVARARIFSAYLRGHMGQAPVADALEELDEVMGVLSGSGDDELLARAYLARAWFLHWLGRAGDAIGDASRALEHAARAGQPALEDDAASAVSAAMRWGPTPWPELERFVEERLSAGSEGRGTRLGSDMLDHRLYAEAARGDFVSARAQFGQRRQDWIDRGATMFLHTLAMSVGTVELRARDYAAAERILSEAWRGLEEAGERGFRSTVGAMLAEALARLGRLDEAEAVADESERLASEDDATTMVGVRRARALVASARGLHEEAIATATDAIRIADGTDYLEERADSYVVLGEALIAAGDGERAAQALREAIALAERKGSTVLAATAGALLDALVGAEAGG